MDEFAQDIKSTLEKYRQSLLNLSSNNPFIKMRLGERSASHIRVVDELPELILNRLLDGKSLEFRPLPPIDDDPKDEARQDFRLRLAEWQLTDETYQTAIENLDDQADDYLEQLREVERELKDRLRAELGLQPRPVGSGAATLREHARQNGINPSFDLPSQLQLDGRHEDRFLQTLLLPPDLLRKGSSIRTKGRTSISESGLEILYLTFGSLQWSDKPRSSYGDKQPLLSPIFILPVELKQTKTGSGYVYSIAGTGEDLTFNEQLFEKLSMELGLVLDRDKLDVGERGETSLETAFVYLQSITDNLRDHLWQVKRQITFGAFSAPSMAMWHDIDPEKLAFQESELIRTLLLGHQGDASPRLPDDEYDTDRTAKAHNKVACIVDADSSQMGVLIDCANGTNLAIEGPPGTGKSQTIVNMVADALYNRKKVLVLAQKAAALNVVSARLEKEGLGEFLLQLQAGRSDRLALKEKIASRLALNDTMPSNQELNGDLERLFELKSKIQSYLSLAQMNVADTGKTIHEVLSQALVDKEHVAAAGLSGLESKLPARGLISNEALRDLEDASVAFSQAHEGSKSESNLWRGVQVADAFQSTREDILRQIQSLADQAESLSNLLGSDEVLACYSHQPIATLIGLFELAQVSNDIQPDTISALAGAAERNEQTHVHSFFALQSRAIQNAVTLPVSDSQWRSVEDVNAVSNLNVLLDSPDFPSEDVALKLVLANIADFEIQLTACQEISNNSNLGPINVALVDSAKLDEFVAKMSEDPLLVTFMSKGSLSSTKAADLKAYLNAYLNACERLQNQWNLEAFQSDTNFELLGKAATTLNPFAGFGQQHKVSLRTLQQAGKSLPNVKKAYVQDAAALKEIQTILVLISNALGAVAFSLDQKSASVSLGNLERLDKQASAVGVSVLLSDLKLDEIASLDSALKKAKLASLRELAFHQKLLEKSKHQYVQAANAIEQVFPKLGLSQNLTVQQARNVALLTSDVANWLAEAPTGLSNDMSKLDKDDTVYLAHHSDKLSILLKSIAAVGTRSLKSRSKEDWREIHSHTLKGEIVSFVDECSLSNKSLKIDVFRNKSVKELWKHLRMLADDEKGFAAHQALSHSRQKLEESGYGPVMEALPEDTHADLYKNLAALHSVAMSRFAEQELKDKKLDYNGASIERIRQEFSRLDKRIIELTTGRIKQSLIKNENAPMGIGVGKKSTYTELSLLKHLVTLQRPNRSPRNLLQNAGNALLELMPCWLSSPPAVAQYLANNEVEFDLCIIDEASQMLPAFALGGVVRSKQIAIVGDTNQLGPTAFFKRSLGNSDSANGDDLDAEEIPEESILELANARFQPKRQLTWHYRSKRQGLIEFSNQYIYDGNLKTLPSADKDNVGVSLEQVKGDYHKGQNEKEAVAVVDAIEKFAEQDTGLSLGVVAMNQKQTELLLTLYEQRKMTSGALQRFEEHWIEANGGLDRLFIKNLENVQGDERDVIFISTVYGPDRKTGKLYQRFGPINGKMGKRRLNVLFTRARYQVRTYSSMMPGMIQAEEDKNPGAHMLNAWLSYSLTGKLPPKAKLTHRETDSPFEDFVKEYIEKIGFEAVPQVGVEGFYVDLGIKHKSWPHGFLLGVECDGATYHSTKSARDRDRLRQEILEGLNWKIYRIWSTDWFLNPDPAKRALEQALNQRLTELLASADSREMPKFVPDVPVNSDPVAGDDKAPDPQVLEADAMPAAIASKGDVTANNNPVGQAEGNVKEKPKLNWFKSKLMKLSQQPTLDLEPELQLQATKSTPNEVSSVLDSTSLMAQTGSVETFNDIKAVEAEKVITVGSRFTGYYEDDPRKKYVFKITEGTPDQEAGLIVKTSPLAKAVIGYGVDDLVEFQQDRYIKKFKILSVEGGQAEPDLTTNKHSNKSAEKFTKPLLIPDDLTEDTYQPTLRRFVNYLVQEFGPLRFSHLTRLVREAHGKGRAGRATREAVEKAASHDLVISTDPNDEKVYWAEGSSVEDQIPFRGLTQPVGRTWDEIPHCEKIYLANQIVNVWKSPDPYAKLVEKAEFGRVNESRKREFKEILETVRVS